MDASPAPATHHERSQNRVKKAAPERRNGESIQTGTADFLSLVNTT
jgi:hypothetical protein